MQATADAAVWTPEERQAMADWITAHGMDGDDRKAVRIHLEVAARQIGPRQVGGTYRSGYWGTEYEVLHIGTGTASRIRGWSPWSITVRGADGIERTHCTAWDAKRDRIISQPTEGASA